MKSGSPKRDVRQVSAPPLAKADFDAVLAFLPAFEAEGFQAGDWLHYEECHPPFLAHRGVVAKFIQALYEHHWILADFDWAAWGNEMHMTRDEWLALCPADESKTENGCEINSNG